MVFEVTGSACEGYKMRQRMVVNIGDEEGNVGLLDFRITTFEFGRRRRLQLRFPHHHEPGGRGGGRGRGAAARHEHRGER